jgi:hypothetical protein
MHKHEHPAHIREEPDTFGFDGEAGIANRPEWIVSLRAAARSIRPAN